MQVTLQLMLSTEDVGMLKELLGAENDAALQATLGDHGTAALAEYVEMYLGRRALTRGSDILEHRLTLLIRHAMKGRIPGPAEVSGLFQTTLSASRAMLRAVLSKYRFHLREAADASAKAALEGAKWDKAANAFQLERLPDNLADVINQKLAGDSEGAKQRALLRKKDSVATFDIPASNYVIACKLFKATEVKQR